VPEVADRPRGVQSNGSHWLDHDDGTVSRVVVIALGGARYERRAFRAHSEAGALALVDRWARERAGLNRGAEPAGGLGA
jgi:hypothetical protein